MTGAELYVKALATLSAAADIEAPNAHDLAFKQYLATYALAEATAALAAATGCSSTHSFVREAWLDVAG